MGITSGASAPETLVDRVIAHFREMGVDHVETQHAEPEDVHFTLPVELLAAVGS